MNKVILATALSFIVLHGLSHGQMLTPSPNWNAAAPPALDARVKITEQYARMVARDAYFWAWPMVNIYNRRP